MAEEVLLVALGLLVLLQATDLREEVDLIKKRALFSQSNQLMNAFHATVINHMVCCRVIYRKRDQGIQKSTTEICKEYFNVDMSLQIDCSSFILPLIFEEGTKINKFRS
jgi:hypothetical protein